MHAPVTEFLSEIKVGAKQTHNNMTLYCLLAAQEATVDFITLDDALARETLMITEMNEGGSVPELRVRNLSDQKVLLLDGEELVGAKQNRVLNVTILLAPQSNTVIPVSCVEQGRWSYRSNRFGSESRSMSAHLRKRKAETVTTNLRRGDRFRSDQGVVWDEIENKHARMAAKPSPTMAMSDLYESFKDSTSDYIAAFRPVSHQMGMLVFIDGVLAGIELIGKFHALEKNHEKLVNSYVMDALETAHLQHKVSSATLRSKASRILESSQAARLEVRPSVALGNDVRLDSKDLAGAGLEFEGQIIQLSVFPRNGSHERASGSRPIARASRRRHRMI